jgi:uncharacterized pyridoxal phosphate-containing UPF0001 family protein
LVVTKGQPAEKMVEAYEAGAGFLVKTILKKPLGNLMVWSIVTALKFQMIGHLQSRKARIVRRFVSLHAFNRPGFHAGEVETANCGS